MATLSGNGVLAQTVERVLQAKGIFQRVVFETGSLVILAHAMRNMELVGVLPSAAGVMFSEESFAKVDVEQLSAANFCPSGFNTPAESMALRWN